ncbi:NAD(P)-binding protein [Basidiobolus meristosporus CBS 931.73]|uniref:NAD(P)-binding protein n=1 Tax=Basidiobolus meristosporus CBS 931.73 TaxID=1314790 RepID=A0A1Y1XI50_9FUNG|nr:NAD(P)-binding protein [Basidiobolus meristosporus CBS 931.73]|eukprot:ORX85372.1 NAD(P)-binding protein [Basidiobolus meristosporus CBS 931.73]
MTLSVLVVGATGALGQNIVKALLQKGDLVKVSALVRDVNKVPKGWESKVQLFTGDLSQPASLVQACQAQEAVVSAVQGGREVVIDGQKNLLEAINQSGSVKHFLPSTFSLDLFQLQDELAPTGLVLRREFADYLSAQKPAFKVTHILNGCFVEVLFNEFQVWDAKTSTLRIWGDGDTRFDIINMEDTGKFVAEAVLDPDVGERFECNGEDISFNEIAERLEMVFGVEVHRQSLGTVEDLRAFVESHLKQNPGVHIPEQYILPLVSGIGKLENLQNLNYPDFKPKSLEQYIALARV